jgi:hypothetical protein
MTDATAAAISCPRELCSDPLQSQGDSWHYFYLRLVVGTFNQMVCRKIAIRLAPGIVSLAHFKL